MELTYNFYNSLVEKNDKWSYLFQGRANEPNVILDDNGISKSFLSKKITLMPNESAEGMSLLVENEPVTNYDKKLFVRFPLEANDGVMTSLDYVLNGKSAELELNSLLPENEDVRYNENEKEIFIDFIHPLLIKSTFVRKPIVEGMTEINEMAEEQLRGLIAERLGSAVGFTVTQDANGNNNGTPNSVDYEMVCDETTDGEGGNPYHMVGMNEKYNNAKEKFLLGVSFVQYIIIYATIYFAAGPLYKLINNRGNGNEDVKFNNGRTIESIAFWVFLLVILSLLITYGVLNSNNDENTQSVLNSLMFSLVVLFLTVFVVYPKKTNEEGFGIPDGWDEKWKITSSEEYAKYNVFTTIFSLFGSNTGANSNTSQPDPPDNTSQPDPPDNTGQPVTS